MLSSPVSRLRLLQTAAEQGDKVRAVSIITEDVWRVSPHLGHGKRPLKR
jgi:hypothetical protein